MPTADDHSLGDAAKLLAAEMGMPLGRRRLLGLMQMNGWVRRGRRNRWEATNLSVDAGLLNMGPGGFYFRNGAQREGAPIIKVTASGLDVLRSRIKKHAEHFALIP